MAKVLYGPDSTIYDTYDAVSPAPGVFTDGYVAVRGRHRMGTQLIVASGRKFRFGLAGASALVVGNVIQPAAIVSTDISMAAAATAAGAKSITFTHGAATVVINYFAEGHANISLAPGAGFMYPISSHAALTSGGADTVYLSEGHEIKTALTTTSDVSLIANPYAGLLQFAASISGPPVGVAVSAIPAADFGWLQTYGDASVLTQGTLVIGANAVADTATAGAAGPATAATEAVIGRVRTVEATTEWSVIFLTLDG